MAKTTVSWQIENADIPDYLEVLCQKWGYQAKIWSSGGLIDNPETKAQFCHRMQAEEWATLLVQYRLNKARNAVSQPTPITIV